MDGISLVTDQQVANTVAAVAATTTVERSVAETQYLNLAISTSSPLSLQQQASVLPRPPQHSPLQPLAPATSTLGMSSPLFESAHPAPPHLLQPQLMHPSLHQDASGLVASVDMPQPLVPHLQLSLQLPQAISQANPLLWAPQSASVTAAASMVPSANYVNTTPPNSQGGGLFATLEMGATEHYIHMPNQEVTVLTPLSNQPVQPLSRPPTLYMDGSVKQCVNCGAIETPTWRRHPVTGSSVCNACGLYFKLHSRDRTFVYNQKGNIVVKRQTRRTTPMKQASKRRKGRVSSLKLLPGSGEGSSVDSSPSPAALNALGRQAPPAATSASNANAAAE